MTIVDRFICRREGHQPSGIITGTAAAYVTSYIVACKRCGKLVEFKPDGTENNT